MFALLRSNSRELTVRLHRRLKFDRLERTIDSQWNRANRLLINRKDGQPIGSRDLLFCECLELFMPSASSLPPIRFYR
jgi:hypothetical protein